MIERMGGARPATAPLRRWLLATPLLATMLLVSLASCSDGDGDRTVGSDTSGDPSVTEAPDEGEGSSGTLELAPSSTTTTTPADLALAQLLLEDPPLDGFVRADGAVGAGPLDLEGAASAEEDSEAEADLLRTLGFERGVSRTWLDRDQDVVYLALYELGAAGDAEAYLAEGVDRLRARGATTFDVPEVDGAVGLTTVEEGPDETFTAHAVAFTSGRRWLLALVGSAGSTRTPDAARALAAAQAARLASPPG